MSDTKGDQPATWIRKGPLRKRWGDMPNSTFADRLNKGLIPKPEHPFGPDTPYWRWSTIEAFEAASAPVATEQAAAS